nr:hypothetical protein [Ensifer sp. ENS01]
METVEAAIGRIGSNRVAIRLSPYGQLFQMGLYPEIEEKSRRNFRSAILPVFISWIRRAGDRHQRPQVFTPNSGRPIREPCFWRAVLIWQ